MATLKLIIEAIKLFLWAFKFIKGEITEAAFRSRVKKIKKAGEKAGTGNLEERLQGGRDVEDNFNRHSD